MSMVGAARGEALWLRSPTDMRLVPTHIPDGQATDAQELIPSASSNNRRVSRQSRPNLSSATNN